jgi:hypothetical protein
MEVVMLIGTRDLKTLFRAQEIVGRLPAEGEASLPRLDQAVDLARASLEARLGRQRYLVEMLTESVAYALPGLNGIFSVQLAEAGSFELQADLPVVTQISALEFAYDDRATQVIHRSGVGFSDREYPL